MTKIKLIFDKPIPAEITANNSHVVENITYTPEVKIHDNIFETPTRHVFCTTRGKVEITDNMFDNMGMAAFIFPMMHRDGMNQDIKNRCHDQRTCILL